MSYNFVTKQIERECFIKLCKNDKFEEAFNIYKQIKEINQDDNERMLGIAISNSATNRLMQVCLLNIDR